MAGTHNLVILCYFGERLTGIPMVLIDESIKNMLLFGSGVHGKC